MNVIVFKERTTQSVDGHGGRDVTISEACLLYRLEYLAFSNLSPLTRGAYSWDIGGFADWVATQRSGGSPTLLRSIDPPLLDRYLDFLSACDLESSYRRRKVAAIRSFFGFLERAGHIPHSPADQLRPPAREFSWPRVLSVVEFTRLREVARRDDRAGAVIELLLQTGLLLSEVSGLQLGDVELSATLGRPKANRCGAGSKGALRINGKGRKQRVVALNWRACEALRSYLKVRQGCNDDHLFLTKFQRGMGPRAVERLVEKYLKAARIDHASVQSLRHTYATHLLRNGASLRFVQETLGHESPDSTRGYLLRAREIEGQQYVL